MKSEIHNRYFIIIAIIITSFIAGCNYSSSYKGEVALVRRGIVVYPTDITSIGVNKWIGIMKMADLNLLGIHGFNENESLQQLKQFLEDGQGKLLTEECKTNHIEIEYETHALHILLPRELFAEHPEYFRMDEKGARRNDFNMCFSSEEAYAEIEKNLTEITRWLKPSTNRYFFWEDDVVNGFCHCDKCRRFTPSEQALIYENRVLMILRKINPSATLAHLAYNDTYTAPLNVKPSEGIFLEYAPIDRDLLKPIPAEHILNLKNNLKVFPIKTAHVLEYWIDVSKFSHWDRDSLVKIPWNKENCKRDARLYSSLGITSITSFGVWINNDYFSRYGEDTAVRVLSEYGSVLKNIRNGLTSK